MDSHPSCSSSTSGVELTVSLAEYSPATTRISLDSPANRVKYRTKSYLHPISTKSYYYRPQHSNSQMPETHSLALSLTICYCYYYCCCCWRTARLPGNFLELSLSHHHQSIRLALSLVVNSPNSRSVWNISVYANSYLIANSPKWVENRPNETIRTEFLVASPESGRISLFVHQSFPDLI